MKFRIFSLLFTSALSLIFAGCRTAPDSSLFNTVNTLTDLGSGNAAVKKKFDLYRLKSTHCKINNPQHPRVIVTGFGSFNSDQNISGMVALAMGARDFWPSNIQLSRPTRPIGDFEIKNYGSLTEYGALLVQRTLKIDDQTYDICFMYLDVLWDLGAAIVIAESRNFKPQMILLTGRGNGEQATIEGAALNAARDSHGFGPEGHIDPENIPVLDQTPILENGPDQLRMNWDQQAISDSITPLTSRLDVSFELAETVRLNNDYICNNLSYAVLAAVEGYPIKLAGNQIIFTSKKMSSTYVGFFHYPSTAPRNQELLSSWGDVLAGIISSHSLQERVAEP